MNKYLFIKNFITRKNLMALTGLFLSFFLIIHLLGNFQLLLPADEAQIQFNAYAKFLGSLLPIKIISYGLYACIIAHAIDGIYLFIKSKIANGVKYAYDKRKRASTWQSRNMTFLGSILLLFLVIHFKDFWFHFKFGDLPLDKSGNKDLYTLVINAFTDWWYVLFYLISILALGFHLLHGIFSAHRSLGLYHPMYAKVVKFLGIGFALVMTFGYMVIPVIIYYNQNY